MAVRGCRFSGRPSTSPPPWRSAKSQTNGRALERPAQVQRQNVLQVQVRQKRFGLRRALRLDALEAAPQRFELLVDDLPVLAIRLCANTRSLMGMKSACSIKCRLINRPNSAALPCTRLPCRTICPSRGADTLVRSIKSTGRPVFSASPNLLRHFERHHDPAVEELQCIQAAGRRGQGNQRRGVGHQDLAALRHCSGP